MTLKSSERLGFHSQKRIRVKHPPIGQNLKDGKDGNPGEIRQAGQTFRPKVGKAAVTYAATVLPLELGTKCLSRTSLFVRLSESEAMGI
jgi:hypothetical protein